CARWAWYFDVW
nr:immunoglobulin heavy chain junction region [Mus musculus]